MNRQAEATGRGGLRRLAVVAFAGLCLLGLALVAVRAGLFRDALRSGFERVLTSAVGQPVTVRELAGPLWPHLELRHVKVGNPEAPGIDVAAIRVAVGRPVLSPRLGWTIDAVRIDGPVLRSDWQGGEDAARTEELSPPDAAADEAPWLRIRELEVTSARLEAQIAGQGRVALAGDARLRDLEVPTGLAGLARSRGELRLEVVEAVAGEALLDEGQLRVRLAQGALRVDELTARGNAGRIEAHGVLDAEGWASGDPSAELRLELEVDRLDLGVLSGRAELASALAGRGELWLHGAGPDLLPQAGRLKVAIQPSASPIGALETGTARLAWQGDALELEALELRGAGFELAAHGRHASGQVSDLRVDARVDDLGRATTAFAPAEELSGSLEAHAELAGPVDRLAGRVVVDGREIAWRGAAWSRIGAELVAEPDAGVRIDRLQFEGQPAIEVRPGGRVRRVAEQWRLEDLELRAEGARIQLHGAADDEGLRGLVLRVADFDLELLRHRELVPEGLGGVVAAELELEGPYAAPRVRGDVRWVGALSQAVPGDDLRLSVAPQGTDHRLEGEARSAGRTWLRGHATLPRRLPEGGLDGLLRSLRFAAELDALALAWFTPWAPPWVESIDGRVGGQFEGSFQGGDPIPLLTGRISVEEAVLELAGTPTRARIDRVDLSLEGRSLVVGDTLVQWIDGESGQQAGLRVEGGLSRQGFSKPFRLRTEGLDAALVASLAALAAPVAGPIDADVRWSGPFGAPSFEGHLVWKDPLLGEVRGDQLEIEARSTDGPIHVKGVLHVGGAAVLRLGGRMPPAAELETEDWTRLLDREGVVFTLHASDVDLGVLSPWIRGAVRDPGGQATGFFEITGASGGPVLAGELELREGSLRVPALATTIAPISGRLSLDPTSLQLQSLRIGGDAGVIRVTGGIARRGLRPENIEVSLVADRFRLRRRGLFETEVTAQATLEGPWNAPVLLGDARLDALDVQVPRLEDPSMSEIHVVRPGDEAAPAAEDDGASGESLPDVAVQVHVGIPAGGRIRGLGADLEVEGDVTIARQPGQPLGYAGVLRVVRGTYVLQGRRFAVTRGVATLDGSPDPDPVLDVEASHPIRDLTIIARLSGPLSDPIVTLSSEPPRPEDEVLAYVLFGRPASQLTASGQSLVSGAAGQLASGLATSRLGELTQRFLRVDTLDVETNGGHPVLGIGKTVNERTFVRIGKSLEIPAEDEIQVEVKLTPQISVQSQITTEGNAGADLLWRLDY